MKLLVHAGTPKTGSTTLQMSLIKSMKLLKENGIFFFQGFGPLRGDKALISLYNLPGENIIKMYGGKKNVLEQSEQEWKNLENLIKNQKVKNLILSSEHFCKERPNNLFWKKIFSLAEDVRIIGYLREPKSLFLSSINQRIKAGIEIKDLFDTNNHWNFYTPSKGLLILKKELENQVILRNFNKQYLYENDILRDFSKLINDYFNKNIQLVNVETFNQSLSGVSLAIIYFLKQSTKPFVRNSEDIMMFKRFINFLKINDKKFNNPKLVLKDKKIYDYISFFTYKINQQFLNYDIDLTQPDFNKIETLENMSIYEDKFTEILTKELMCPDNNEFIKFIFSNIKKFYL